MALFQVDRTQYPIGQGGFHSMALHCSGNRSFSMVVDCGGSRAKHRKLLAEAFAERKAQHDFLAISHLDDDHINGLRELTDAGVSFGTVFLPHVDMSSYLKWMTLKLSARAGKGTGNVLAGFAKVATLLYDGQFGPVVLVGNPGDNDGAGSDPAPPEDQFGDHVLSSETRQVIAIAKLAKGAKLSCSTSLTFDLDWLIRFYSREWRLPKEVDSIWNLQLLKGLLTTIQSIKTNFTPDEWIAFADALKSDLKKMANKSLSTEPASLVSTGDPRAQALANLGKDIATGKVSCKKLLTRLYKIFTSLHDYNDASMCVYSGPAERGIGVRRRSFKRTLHSGGSTASASNEPTRKVAWIHTGDANFTDHSRLKDFLDHYITEASLTSVLVLPHHGSRFSFDPGLDCLRGLAARLAEQTVFVAPADPHGKYRHPDGGVIHACHLLGDLAIVDEDSASYYSESVNTARPWDPYWDE